MDFNYYYNNVPNQGLCRNNLIYTSLISPDQKVFCQWYYNDTDYHKGQNQVVDPEKMEEKWEREIKYLKFFEDNNPEIIPRILDIDYKNRKIFLEIDGVDFWQRSLDKNNCSFDEILPDWQDQMLNMIEIYQNLNIYKYSMHPSSYFIVEGKLKSINYFFTYSITDNLISIKDVESHIYSTRQNELKKYTEQLGIIWDQPQNFDILQRLCWESFRTNYPKDFIEKVLCIK